MSELKNPILDDSQGESGDSNFTKSKISADVSNNLGLSGITPRHSMDGDIHVKATPYSTLVQLASALNQKSQDIDPLGMPTTPEQARYRNYATPSSFNHNAVGLSQNRRPFRRTPGRATTTLNSLTAKAPKSPHVIRAWEQKLGRAAPGRRKSFKFQAQRDSPFDDLRQLSRLLAPKSKPPPPLTPGTPITAPQSSPAKLTRRSSLIISRGFGNRDDDDDTEELPAAPRMSVDPVDEDNARFEKQPVPRLPFIPAIPRCDGELSPTTRSEEGDTTAYSIEVELPRRATSEGPLFSRPEFHFHLSDIFHDVQNADLMDSSFTEEIGGHQDSMALDLDEDAGGDYSYEDNVEFGIEDNTDNRRDSYLDQYGDDEDTDRLDIGHVSIDNSFLLPEMAEHEQETEDSVTSHAEPEELPAGSNINGWKATAAKQLQKTASAIRPTMRGDLKSRKPVKVSKHGLAIPSLPPSVIKKLASTFSSSPIPKQTLDAIAQCTDIFFERVSNDLASYASHAKRKTIEDSDVIQLLKRQRFLNGQATAFSLAEKHLPRELLQEIRMPVKRFETKSAGQQKQASADVVN